MTRKIKILQDLDLPKRTLREPPKANYTCHSNNILPTAHLRPSSCWNEGLYLVKNSLEMARAASNHQHTLPMHERHIQTAHASGEPLQQQFRGVVGALAEAVSDPRSARKHLLGYFTYAFVCQGSV